MRIAIVGPARFGVAEPFAGGLEAHTAHLAMGLQTRGHDVVVYSGHQGSVPHPDLDVRPIVREVRPASPAGTRPDIGGSLGWRRLERRSLTRVMDELGGVDIVHDNSLHPVPVERSPELSCAVVHGLHTPPLPPLVRAHRTGTGTRVAVSGVVADSWAPLSATVIRNGVVDRNPGPGGTGRAVWVGRIVPEKAPHLAIEAAHLAGFDIDLVGPTHDDEYASANVFSRLGPRDHWWGHRSQTEIAEISGRAEVGFVTPQWSEPFGLVVAEVAMAGTPVAALPRGAMQEVVGVGLGVVAERDDPRSLATAALTARRMARADIADAARKHFGLESMIDAYERLYERVIADGPEASAGAATSIGIA